MAPDTRCRERARKRRVHAIQRAERRASRRWASKQTAVSARLAERAQTLKVSAAARRGRMREPRHAAVHAHLASSQGERSPDRSSRSRRLLAMAGYVRSTCHPESEPPPYSAARRVPGSRTAIVTVGLQSRLQGWPSSRPKWTLRRARPCGRLQADHRVHKSAVDPAPKRLRVWPSPCPADPGTDP